MRLLIVGAGGHAKVIIDAARAAKFDIAGVVGDAQGRTDLLGIPISATPDELKADAFVIAVGDNRARAALFDEYLETGMRPAVVVHPSATIANGVEIGGGTFIAGGVVVNVDTRIGDNVILNTSCTVDHDCLIGDHAHVGPMTGLCGGVRVGAGTLIGAGCTVIPTRSIGEWTVIGAGSSVVRDVPDDELYAGVPARPLRPTEE